MKLFSTAQECSPLEFNVHFSGIKGQEGKDVTINWKDLEVLNKGFFYTDSNGLGMIKRHFKDIQDLTENQLKSIAPSNYYPINSAIFLEDTKKEN